MTTQNQPQKKIKILQLLRAIQAEQLSKLQQKYQQEQELLEDVRNYTKQRSTIEREYSQALQKLNAYFLPKKEFSTDDSTGENGNRTPQGVWKSLLEEAEKKAKKHLAISEELQGQMAESMKTLKLNKTQAFKKCEELTKKIHEEVFETVRELSKAKKGYEDLEKLAQAAREQAADAEDKLKKKNVKFFQSKTSLEKNVTKSSGRLEICERRTATARNEYLLSLAAANAHMTRYFCKELQEIMTSLDGDFLDKMRGYFTTLGQLEVDASKNAMAGFESVVSQANSICRDISLQLFLSKNKVFSEVVQYDFEPCRNDKVRKVTTEHSAGLSLNKEARKLAMKLTKDQMTIKTKSKQLQSVKTGEESPSAVSTAGDAGNQESEQNPEALKESIRLAETNKLKTEACLEVLREAGVNVDEWLKSANSLSPNDMEADTLSQYSLNDGCADDDWDDLDDTFTADYSSDDDARSVLSNSSMPVACVALYNYDATNADELTITEGEELEILEKDGDGWCRGRNKSGQIGYFPESYVETESTTIQPSSAASPKNSCTDGPFSGSSVNSQNINKTPATEFLCYVRALYDYEAMGDDEISFKEGDIVGVLSKDENDIDDGFWYGEFQGCRGVFPSLVVEDIPEGYHTRDTNMNVTESLTPPASSYFNTRDDYVTLPLDYTANGGSAAAAASNALQPVRKAPPPPASSPQIPRSTTMSTGGTRALLPQNRQRARTENTSTMTKPDAAGFARSISQNAALQAKMYENIDQLAPSSRPPDYVNVTNLPTSRVNGGPSTSQSVSSSFPKPAARSRRPAPPPKPAPPTSSSRRTFRSLSYV